MPDQQGLSDDAKLFLENATNSTPADSPSIPRTPWIGLVGCLGLLIVVVGIPLGIYYAFWTSRPAVISLAAYFVEDPKSPEAAPKSHIKISGKVHHNGEPLTKGNVRLTVSKKDLAFQQVVSVDLENGMFKTEDESLRALHPDDPIRITAEVSPSQTAATVTQDLYLNSTPPAVSSTTQIVLWTIFVSLLILSFVLFLITFTGTRTAGKNRFAIIFSYCIIGVSLLVPLVAPVLLLHVFPGLRRAMVGAPAGLVVTRVGSPPNDQTQWALNIGGFSRWEPIASESPVAAQDTATAKTAATPTATPAVSRARARTSPTPGVASASPSPAGSGSPSNVPAGASSQPAISPPAVVSSASPPPNSSPTPLGSPSQTVASANSSPGGTPANVSQVELPPGSPQQIENAQEVVSVEGGLVIPLYVIILSLIGGAINMTRKVPRFQGEGEHSQQGLPNRESAKIALREIDAGVRNLIPSKVAPSASAGATEKKPNEEAKDIDVEVDQMVKEQVSRNSDSKNTISVILKRVQRMRELFEAKPAEEPLLGFQSFEDWIANRVSLREVLGSNWRVELLNQYMYLISAPFLAIVAYYMLDLLGLTKQPILVLISFSVGLISEKILVWLLGIAKGYMRTDANTEAAAAR